MDPMSGFFIFNKKIYLRNKKTFCKRLQNLSRSTNGRKKKL